MGPFLTGSCDPWATDQKVGPLIDHAIGVPIRETA
jgi:hypothetical protein